MHLSVLTPEKTVFQGETSQVTLPGVDGSFQVLNNHAPLISLLKEGMLRYKTSSENEIQLPIAGGVVEVKKNAMVILLNTIIE